MIDRNFQLYNYVIGGRLDYTNTLSIICSVYPETQDFYFYYMLNEITKIHTLSISSIFDDAHFLVLYKNFRKIVLFNKKY
jgi:hypothetical protein